MAYGLWRALVVLHRYLGVAVGLLMAVWFVSGIVMMYVGFPRLTETERVRALAPIPWQACCQFGEGLLADDQPIVRAQLESHLVFGAQVQLLHMTPLAQIPNVQLVAVPAFEENLGIHAVLHHIGRAPFAAHYGVQP